MLKSTSSLTFLLREKTKQIEKDQNSHYMLKYRTYDTTAASEMFGWTISMASSSAGAT